MTDLRTAAQQAKIDEIAVEQWKLRMVFYDENGEPSMSRQPEPDEIRAALAQQAEPPVDDPHRDHWVAIAEAAQKIAASTECGPAEAEALCAALDRLTAAALAQQAEPVEPVARVVEHGATVRLEWVSADAAHNAKVGPLFSMLPQRKPLVDPAEYDDAGAAERYNRGLK